MTVAQAATRVNVSPVTIRKWIRQGKLAGVQVHRGGAMRVPESEFARLVEDARDEQLDRQVDFQAGAPRGSRWEGSS